MEQLRSTRRNTEPNRPTRSVGARMTVGPGIKLKGEVSDCDTLVVEGTVEATLVSEVLEVAEGGTYNGNAAPNVSRWQLNLGSDHDVAAVPGLTLSARMIASSAQHVDAANLRRIPGWTRWDIGARYKTRAGGRPLVLRASVDNLFNRNYWSSGSGNWLYVGSPRTVTLSATVDF